MWGIDYFLCETVFRVLSVWSRSQFEPTNHLSVHLICYSLTSEYLKRVISVIESVLCVSVVEV